MNQRRTYTSFDCLFVCSEWCVLCVCVCVLLLCQLCTCVCGVVHWLLGVLCMCAHCYEPVSMVEWPANSDIYMLRLTLIRVLVLV